MKKVLFCAAALAAVLAAPAGTVRAWWHFDGTPGKPVSSVTDATGAFTLNVCTNKSSKWDMSKTEILPLSSCPGALPVNRPDPADPLRIVSAVLALPADQVGKLLPVCEDRTGAERHSLKSFTFEIVARREKDSSGEAFDLLNVMGSADRLVSLTVLSNGKISLGVDRAKYGDYGWKGTGGTSSVPVLPRDGQWHHIALAYDDNGSGNAGRICVYGDRVRVLDVTLAEDTRKPGYEGVVKLRRNLYADFKKFGPLYVSLLNEPAAAHANLVTVDEIRVSDGALEPDAMLRIKPDDRTICSEDFESASPKVRFDAKYWSVREGAGRRGSRGLVCENRDPETRSIASIPLSGLRPGFTAHIEARLKIVEIHPKNARVDMCVNWTKAGTGAFLGGSGLRVPTDCPGIERDSDGWLRLQIDVSRIPTDANTPALLMFFYRGATGKIVFDDIKVTLGDEKHILNFANSAYQAMADSGPVRFGSRVIYDLKACADGNVPVRFVYRDAAGKRVVAKPDEASEKGVFVTLDAERLARGRQLVRIDYLDASGRALETAETAFTRVEKLPARKVRIDRFGRAIVDGKPFFPLGLYWHEDTFAASPANLERYAKGPFNCLVNYEKSMTRRELDAYWERGLKVIVSVKDLFLRSELQKVTVPPPDVKDESDEIRHLGEVVNECKNHPSLLAWYVCDEMPFRMLPKMRTRYEMLKALDPDHPQFMCIGTVADALDFVNCCDTIGHDSYPIGLRELHPKHLEPEKGAVWMAGDGAALIRDNTLDFRSCWQIPQAFAWSQEWLNRDMPQLRFPTYRELRSMLWQMIAEGANGLLPWSYGCLLRWDAAALEKNWDIVCRACADVKRMIPVLTLEPGPKLTPPKGGRVRTWRDGKTLYVLVCNKSQERCVGTVALPGRYELRETIGAGVRPAEDRLEVDLASMDYAIVRLEVKP